VLLLTGGLGYIGSHMAALLIEQGQSIVIVDNLCNSQLDVLHVLESFYKIKIPFFCLDVADPVALEQVFQQHVIKSVIHFAAYKSINESVERPIQYYKKNVGGTLNLLETMQRFGVKRIVFSSTAAVYGVPERLPVTECAKIAPTNPYGHSKWIAEQVLRDVSLSEQGWQIAILRYFNPVGAHSSGLLGENSQGEPVNLMPYVAQVAAGWRQQVNVFGQDYPTHDGTGVRDYIHIMDLVEAHAVVLQWIAQQPDQCITFNVGCGRGYSVLEMIAAFERISGQPIAYQIMARRTVDVAEIYADPSAFETATGWVARRGLDDMVTDLWRFQKTKMTHA
jgi:UDP-glucose 4-epimerase